MTDPKKPYREWKIQRYLIFYPRPGSPPGNQLCCLIEGPDTVEQVHVIEHAALLEAQGELASAKAEIDRLSKDCSIIHESDKAEIDTLRAENAQLAIKLHEANMATPVTNSNWPHEAKLHKELQQAKDDHQNTIFLLRDQNIKLQQAKGELEQWKITYDANLEERDELRAEIEALKQDITKILAEQSEPVRMREPDMSDALEERVEELLKERDEALGMIEKLVGALEHYVRPPPDMAKGEILFNAVSALQSYEKWREGK